MPTLAQALQTRPPPAPPGMATWTIGTVVSVAGGRVTLNTPGVNTVARVCGTAPAVGATVLVVTIPPLGNFALTTLAAMT